MAVARASRRKVARLSERQDHARARLARSQSAVARCHSECRPTRRSLLPRPSRSALCRRLARHASEARRLARPLRRPGTGLRGHEGRGVTCLCAAKREYCVAMPTLRDIPAGAWVAGPWRAVLVLGVTQIIAWGMIFYSPVLLAPLIAAEHGWSLSFTMSGFSLGLLIAGLVSPFVGRSIDSR